MESEYLVREERPGLYFTFYLQTDQSATVLFSDVLPDAGVTQRTREMVLFSVAVPGVPPIHVEEALWTVWDIVASG